MSTVTRASRQRKDQLDQMRWKQLLRCDLGSEFEGDCSVRLQRQVLTGTCKPVTGAARATG